MCPAFKYYYIPNIPESLSFSNGECQFNVEVLVMLKKGMLFLFTLCLLCFTGICEACDSSVCTDNAASSDALMSYSGRNSPPDYSDRRSWAFLEKDDDGSYADVFFVAPTVCTYRDSHVMRMDDEVVKAKFLGSINMEIGIYNDDARVFAPYYRQAALNVYNMEPKYAEQYLNGAYLDVKSAFEYYMRRHNGGRPVILAGFSQGADMCIRLMKDFCGNKSFDSRIIACYALGWRVTPEELSKHANIRMAKSEDDVGTIVCFDCESEDVKGTIIIPEGMKSLSINPLTWRTDSSYAEKTLNRGACFTDYSGEVTKEVPEFTGAYICPERGVLKISDVRPSEYPKVLDIFPDGSYHVYDYMFFYRNLQENVAKRIEAYKRLHK